MNTKIRLALIMGGESPEHQISLLSAGNVLKALDSQKYDISVIGIQKTGTWTFYPNGTTPIINPTDASNISLNTKAGFPLSLTPGAAPFSYHPPNGNIARFDVDIALPILHGTFGEDGCVQGLLAMLHVPYIGCSLISSAQCMDKVCMKKILSHHNIPSPNFLDYGVFERENIQFNEIENSLGLPVFVKPANMGSSIGISKVAHLDHWLDALELAFKYDDKVIIEQAITGRELECAILGNENPKASKVGEVQSTNNFYSYDYKYLDSSGAELTIPANIPNELEQEIQTKAIEAYQALGCQGMARVDFFLTEKNEVLVNEINTIPGFTDISQFPQLWKASGLSENELLDELIQLALA